MATNDSNKWESDPEYIELMNFLIEKTKNAKSPLKIRELAEEYKEKKGARRKPGDLGFSAKIRILAAKCGKMENIEWITKIKLCFALSACLNRRLLEEFRWNAHVEVDERNRITKYRANDGSVNLEGEHHPSRKSKARKRRRERDGSGIPESTKKPAPEMADNSSKRPRIDHWKPVNYVPLENHPFSGSMEILNHPKVQLPQELSREPPNSRIQELREPKREIKYPEAIEAPEASVFRNEAILRIPEPPGAPAFRSPTRDAYTPQIRFLEAIQSLVLCLGISPSEIHQKIQQKIQNLDGITTIQNNEVTLALELLVARIVNHSVPSLPENVKSISLKEFLCYLKAAIMNSKLEGLENLIRKIEENIKEPESMDKNFPVEKVKKALQDTLNIVGF